MSNDPLDRWLEENGIGAVFWRFICAPLGFAHIAYQLVHLFMLVMDEIFMH